MGAGILAQRWIPQEKRQKTAAISIPGNLAGRQERFTPLWVLQPVTASGWRQREEHYRLKKIRIIDFLEGRTARILAIALFIGVVLILAFIMSQTA